MISLYFNTIMQYHISFGETKWFSAESFDPPTLKGLPSISARLWQVGLRVTSGAGPHVHQVDPGCFTIRKNRGKIGEKRHPQENMMKKGWNLPIVSVRGCPFGSC